MRKLVVVSSLVLLVFIITTPATGAMKKQIFAGSGLVSPWNGEKSVSGVWGIAVILPVASQKIFLRPLFGGGANLPLNGSSAILLLQGGVLVGFKIHPRVSVLVGGAMVVSLPTQKPRGFLPTALFSSAIRLTPHWGIFFPIAVNKKGAGLQVQIGYTW